MTQTSCRKVRSGPEFVGKQGLTYAPGISAESVGSRGIHLQTLSMPPGARAKAHKHEAHETAIYVLSGEAGMWFGERLEEHLSMGPGDYLYIPADVRTCPTTRARASPALPSSPGPTPTSRRASCSCRSSTTCPPGRRRARESRPKFSPAGR